MLVSNSEALERLSSPANLINRLKSITTKPSSLDIFGAKKQHNNNIMPFVPGNESNEPTIDSLIDNADSKIKLAVAHDNAIDLLEKSISMLSTKLDDIKPEKLPSVITAASKMVNDIRRERNEANKARTGRDVHLHFYTPVQKQETEYKVIEVG